MLAPLQQAEVHDLVFDTHLVVQPAFLRHISDEAVGMARCRFSIDCYRAGIAHEYGVDDSEQCGFSCAVRAEKSAYRAGFDVEAHVVESSLVGIMLGKAGYFKYVHSCIEIERF